MGKLVVRSAVAMLAAVAGLGLGSMAMAGGKPLPKPAPRNWNTVVTMTPQGTHLLGNPAAKLRLTQFVSYTCPHCSHFEQEAEAQLRLTWVAGGKGSIEVRNFVRDPIDLTVAMLTNCGSPAKFFGNHTMFMRQQAKWIQPLASPGPTQQQRWGTGTFAQRTRYIAQDLGFYPMMASRGYSTVEIDKCLADEAMAKRLAAGTQDAAQKFEIPGTPSFAVNDQLLADTFTWEALRPQLASRLGGN